MVEHVRKRHTLPVYAEPKGGGATSEDTRILGGARREGDEGCVRGLPTDSLPVARSVEEE